MRVAHSRRQNTCELFFNPSYTCCKLDMYIPLRASRHVARRGVVKHTYDLIRETLQGIEIFTRDIVV